MNGRIAVLMLALLVLAGSAVMAGGSQEIKKDAAPAAAPAAKAQKVAILHYMGEQVKRNGMQAWVDSVMKKNPEVVLEVQGIAFAQYGQLLRTRIAAGDAPDLMQGRPREFLELVKGDVVMDLSGQTFMSRLNDYSYGQMEVEGKYYGVPIDHSLFLVFYNREMFEKAGVKVPTTVSEWVKVCETFQAAGIPPIAFPFKDKNAARGEMHALLHGPAYETKNENWMLDVQAKKKTHADYPFVKEAFGNYMKLLKFKDPGDFGIDPPQVISTFAAGRRPMLWQGFYAVGDVRSANPAGKFGVFQTLWSDDPSKNKITVGLDDCFMVYKNTKVKEGAFKFLDHVTGTEGVQQWVDNTKLISTMKNVQLKNADEMTLDVMKLLEKGSTPWMQLNSGEAKDKFMNTTHLFASLKNEERSADGIIQQLDKEFASIK